jgi:RNA polymerase I-specific transcription initiation factor RRN7
LIKDGAGNRSTEESPTLHRALPAMTIKEGEDALHPGQLYTIYSSRDVSGTLPDRHELIIGRAARWVGVSDDHLCAVVERFERRLMSWWENRKRLEKDRERRKVGMDEEGSGMEAPGGE